MKNGKHLVFVYGILKTEDCILDPPDSVPGTMFVRSIALGKFGARYTNNIIRGQVREVDDEMLRRWDQIEGIDYNNPSRGMYRRIRVTTTAGDRTWAYEYNGDVESCRVVFGGVWRGYAI